MLVGTAGTAAAQDVSKEEVARFKEHLKEGGALIEKREYEDGIIELKRARRIIDHPKITLSIAAAYARWGRCPKAQQEYTALLARDKLDDELRKKAAAGLQGLDKCVDSGTLVVSCSPEQAEVSIDAREPIVCPVETDLKVGPHQIEVSAPGYEPSTQTVEIDSDQTTQVSMALRPQVVRDTGGQKQVHPPEPAEPAGPAEPAEPAWYPWVTYGSLGAGGVLVGAGLLNDIVSVGRTDEIAAAQSNGDRQQLEDLQADADASYTRSILFYSSGAVLLATGVTLHMLEFGPEGEPRWRYSKAAPKASIVFTGTGISTRIEW